MNFVFILQIYVSHINFFKLLRIPETLYYKSINILSRKKFIKNYKILSTCCSNRIYISLFVTMQQTINRAICPTQGIP